MLTPPNILTIAGSDSGGGAGIQADIKTITAHKMYAMSVITALTAQNTTGVYGIMEASPEFVGQQMDCVFTDIVPDSVKIGMVSNSGIIRTIVDKLEQYAVLFNKLPDFVTFLFRIPGHPIHQTNPLGTEINLAKKIAV